LNQNAVKWFLKYCFEDVLQIEEGAKVVLNYRKKKEEAEKTLSEFKKISSDIILIQADVSLKEDVDRLFDEIDSVYNGVDILVNNAGLGIAYPLINYPDDLWDKLININLKSAYLCSKRAAEYMIKKKWGRIINITSIAGLTGMKMLSPYSAAKAGLIGLTKTTALELSEYNIDTRTRQRCLSWAFKGAFWLS